MDGVKEGKRMGKGARRRGRGFAFRLSRGVEDTICSVAVKRGG